MEDEPSTVPCPILATSLFSPPPLLVSSTILLVGLVGTVLVLLEERIADHMEVVVGGRGQRRMNV